MSFKNLRNYMNTMTDVSQRLNKPIKIKSKNGPIEINASTYSILTKIRNKLATHLPGMYNNRSILTDEKLEKYRYEFIISLRLTKEDILQEVCIKKYDAMLKEMTKSHDKSLAKFHPEVILSEINKFKTDNPGLPIPNNLPQDEEDILENFIFYEERELDKIIIKYFTRPHSLSISFGGTVKKYNRNRKYKRYNNYSLRKTNKR